MNSFLLAPKADLHVHLEGTVSRELLLSLAEKNKINLITPVIFPSGYIAKPPVSIGQSLPQFGNFIDFIGYYAKITECISSAEDIIDTACAYAASAREDNITYAEVYFSPSTFQALGKKLEPLYEGLAEAEQKCLKEFGIKLRWIFDIVRNSPSDPHETISMALDARERKASIVAIGLAGYESGFPASAFKNAFEHARSEGFTVLAHAGELEGPESIWDTINTLHPKRIGHGITAVKDPVLIEYLEKHQIPLEVSPWSNIALAGFTETNHPIAQLVNAGLSVILSADDPGIFGKSLNDNYLFAQSLGVSEQTLSMLAQQSLNATFHS